MNKTLIKGTNYDIYDNGNIVTHNWKNTGKTAVIKPAKDKKGYLRVGLIIEGRLQTRKVHRLVAESFIENPENKPCVNHKNGIKTDNRVENLEWVTYLENYIHAFETGLIKPTDPKKSINKVLKKGELNGYHILKEHEVIEIRRLFKPRVYTRKMLAEAYNVTESCIKDVLLRKSWKHI